MHIAKRCSEAYENVLPAGDQGVISGEPKDFDLAQAQTNLKKWLEQNVPKNYKIHPDEAPIIFEVQFWRS